jgi:hypothetical protein
MTADRLLHCHVQCTILQSDRNQIPWNSPSAVLQVCWRTDGSRDISTPKAYLCKFSLWTRRGEVNAYFPCFMFCSLGYWNQYSKASGHAYQQCTHSEVQMFGWFISWLSSRIWIQNSSCPVVKWWRISSYARFVFTAFERKTAAFWVTTPYGFHGRLSSVSSPILSYVWRQNVPSKCS